MMSTMTTEHTDPTQAAGKRVLRRRSSDRVIGGVASGLGDFFNVDPLLIRIALVGLMVFGGLGLVLYVGAWLLLPNEDDDASIAEQALAGLGLSPSRLASILLLLIGGILIIAALSNAIYGSFIPTAAMAFVVIAAGIALLRQGEHPAAASSAVARPTARKPAPVVATEAAVAPAVRRPRRPASPLGWYVLAATLCAIGLLALAGNVASVEIGPGQFLGLALAVLGIGLVVGAWWGHAQMLILLGLMILPFAVVAGFVTAPLEGGVGDHRFAPATAPELRGEYRLVGGRLVLDLSAVEATSEPISIEASVAVGTLYVVLPVDAGIRLDAQVGAGDMVVLGTRQTGTALADRYLHDDSSAPAFILDLETGIGELIVDGGPLGGR